VQPPPPPPPATATPAARSAAVAALPASLVAQGLPNHLHSKHPALQ
jgi:hypothetical protein